MKTFPRAEISTQSWLASPDRLLKQRFALKKRSIFHRLRRIVAN